MQSPSGQGGGGGGGGGEAAAQNGWSNDCRGLPAQQESYVAYAAQALAHKEMTVPVPSGMDRMSVPKERYRLASQPQTRLVQDAHAACNRVTILERDCDVDRLLRSERAEIEAAARSVMPPDDTLPPRAFGVTVLVNPVNVTNATAILDAVAHLARAPSADGFCRRAVESMRMAFLAGGTARKYAVCHGSDAARTTSNFLKGTNELCLVWAEPRASEDESGEEVWCMRAEFAELPYCTSTEEYANQIRTLTHRLWATTNFLPEPTRLLGSYALNEPPDGAYVRSVVDCADDFWKRLHCHAASACRFSDFVTNDETYAGLEFSKQFVKLIPRPQEEGKAEVPPDHPSVYHGLLLHQVGKEAESREFCETIRREECAKAQAAGRRSGIFGLRPPLTPAEEVVCPHLLFMTASATTFGQDVTSYGLLASPGIRIYASAQGVAQLKYRILPVDGEILDRAFVLPCTMNACNNPKRAMVFKPMWEALHEAIKEYAHVFGYEQPEGSDVRRRRTRETIDFPELKEELRPPTQEEHQTGVLLGVPLTCTAFCVGDVYNVLREEQVTPSVCRFLLAAASRFGSETSIEAVFDLTKHALVESERLAKDHEQTVRTLKRTLADSELRVEVLEAKNAAKDANRNAPPAPVNSGTSTALPSVSASITAMADCADSDEEEACRKKQRMQTIAITNVTNVSTHAPSRTGALSCTASQMAKLLESSLNVTLNTTQSVLRTNFRVGDVRVACRALEDAFNAESMVLENSTVVWAVNHFKQQLPSVPSVLQALADIFCNGTKSLLNNYQFAPGTEWTIPILLWISKDEIVNTYVVDEAARPHLVSPFHLLDVDLVRTPIAYWKEASRGLGFAAVIETNTDTDTEANADADADTL